MTVQINNFRLRPAGAARGLERSGASPAE